MTSEPAEPKARDSEFEALGQRFLQRYLEQQPVFATAAGDHRFDTQWPNVSATGEADQRALLTETASKLAGFEDAQLSLENSIDKGMLENRIRMALFTLDELQPAVRDPLFYTGLIGDGLDPLLTREFAPIEKRAQSLAARLEAVASLLAVAKSRLKNPTEVHTQTAMEQNKGLIELCEKGLRETIAGAGASRPRLEQAAIAAAKALRDFQVFLEGDLAKRASADYRLGRDRFEKKLRLELDDPTLDVDALVRDAHVLLSTTRGEMLATSKELWPELMKGKPWKEPKSEEEAQKTVRQVLVKLGEDRSSNKTIVQDAELALSEATAFVKKNDLVRLPDEPCKVIEMPEYRRGVAIAYCDSSGPLEAKPETFYAIAPTPKDWKKARVDSFYREYNRSMLRDLTVHEAMPGHFLQAMHNNRFPSKLRAVFSHGAFVEGWAVYTEWLMARYGFGGPKVRLQRQKMTLRVATNAILDHGVHAGTMTEKEALALMMNEGFQEEGEAVGKWRRARLTSAQLSTYFYGFSEMMRLRKSAEARKGFSERAYHDELLAHGSPAPRYLARLLER